MFQADATKIFQAADAAKMFQAAATKPPPVLQDARIMLSWDSGRTKLSSLSSWKYEGHMFQAAATPKHEGKLQKKEPKWS